MLKGFILGLSVAVVLALLVTGWVWWKRARLSKPFVIGEQMAQARRVEQARLARPNLEPSPLSANMQYDRWAGDFDLSDPVKLPLDDELSALCQRFATSDAPVRSRLRDSISMDDFYTLLTFSQRSAVFAMRERNSNRIVNGLTALAMIEQNRIDFRDALGSISLLYHAARTIGADADRLFGTAQSLSEPGMSELILGFLKRSEEKRDIRKSWGYAVVGTKAGPGFVRWGFAPYEATYPLDQIGLALAQLIKRDKYQPGIVTLASRLPPVWLSSVDEEALKSALASVRAAVTIHGDLRPQESEDSKNQVLMMFLAELDSEAAAESLCRLAREKRSRKSDFSMIEVKEGRLFCLTVARCVMSGRASMETPSSMKRFSTGIADVLKRGIQN